MPRIRSVADGLFLGTVLIDTREKAWYSFANLVADKADGGGPFNVPIRRVTLQSGDYSLAGYEGLVAVERKSLSDAYSTLGQGRDRFERELNRLNGFDFAAVVIEAGWDEILHDPPPHTEVQPKTVFRSILAWQQRYPRVHWWPCADRRHAEVTTFRILERFWKERKRAETEGRPVVCEVVSA